MWNKTKKAGIFLIWMLMVVLLALIVIGSFCFLNPDAMWVHTYTKNYTCVLLCGVFVLALLFVGLFRLFWVIQERYLNWIALILIGIFIVGEIIMLRMFYVVPITDAYKVADSAMALLQGDIHKIDEYGSYFSYYGNNYFVVLLFRKLYYLMYALGETDPYRFLFLVNAGCLLISVVLAWICACLVVGKRRACMVLLLIVMNPVFYGVIFWTYTCTMSMPVMMGILYCGLKLISSKQMGFTAFFGAGIGVLTVVGYFLRPTAVFPLIALIIVSFCHIKRNSVQLKKIFLIGAAFLLCSGLAIVYVNSKICTYTTDTSRNLPITHWIMMGLKDDGQFNIEDERFSMAFMDKEATKEGNIQVIRERLTDMGFEGVIKHEIKKLSVTWCDGTHGFMDRLKQDTKFSHLYLYMAEGKTDAIILYCQIFHILLFGLALIACILQIMGKKWEAGMQLVGITVFGGIIFYLIWEAKNVYSIPFLMFISILASQGVPWDVVDRRAGCLKVHVFFRSTGIAVMVLTVAAGILQFNNYTSVNRVIRNYTVNVYSNPSSRKITDLSEKNRSIEQSFYGDRSFNKIYIRACVLESGDEETNYLIELKQDDGAVLSSKVATSADLVSRVGKKTKDGYICLEFEDIVPKEKTKYTISITAMHPGSKDSLEWWYRQSLTMDNYEGTILVDHEERKDDLFIVVSNEKEEPYTKAGVYVMIVVVLLLVEASVLFFSERQIKKIMVV